ADPRRSGPNGCQFRLESQRNALHRAEPGRHLPAAHHVRGEGARKGRSHDMSAVLLICQKELKGYFASPIAYLLMAFFALIFGFGMYTATRDVLRFSFQMQMQGQSAPMNLNQQVITPLLGFGSTISLFLIPMITMRLFAEEKRSGTIELLLTSP